MRSFKIGNGRKAVYSAVVEQIHVECLDRVFKMMCERNLVATELGSSSVESSPSNISTERAGVFFVS